MPEFFDYFALTLHKYMRLLKYTDSMTCKLYFGMGQTLVLNASYEPLNITSWRRAVILMIKGKAESLEEDKTYSIHSGKKLPTVIRLRYYVKVPFREVSLTRKNILLRDNNSCQYCNHRGSDLSIDHVLPRSQGGLSTTENCVPACLSCNGDKSDENALYWYRKQKFYDPRRAMAIRAWLEGDLRLAIRLLQWANPNFKVNQNYEKDESEFKAA